MEKKSQTKVDHILLKFWPKIFTKKNSKFRKICNTNDINKKNASPSPGGAVNYKN